jgi:hypothetical protein
MTWNNQEKIDVRWLKNPEMQGDSVFSVEEAEILLK